MNVGDGRHLTYCLNVHRGETWAENFAAIREHAVAVRDRVAPGRPFGLGLRLSENGARGIDLCEAKNLFERENLYAFTINGFPYGSFHGGRVKENVYRPDWSTDERRDYTMLLADILAELLPAGMRGSISTVPCSYKAWRAVPAPMAERLIECARHFDAILERTGREIHLGLEPEPDCSLETTPETVRFFREVLFPAARDAGVEEIVRRHIGVCLDTCHAAVEFEDPAECLRQLRVAGIRVSKIQISAALAVAGGAEGRSALAPFCEPVYLHQVKARMDGGMVSWPDLPEALDDVRTPEEWRVHFHVPLFWKGEGVLRSTASTMTDDFWREARASGVEHFEIETYTFDVLPPELREGGVVESISREYQWVLAPGRLGS